VKDDLLGDALLHALTLRLQKIDNPGPTAFSAMNNMADPQRWLLFVIRAFHKLCLDAFGRTVTILPIRAAPANCRRSLLSA
jgi:hypothetical protein